jgi:hypothetical protein
MAGKWPAVIAACGVLALAAINADALTPKELFAKVSPSVVKIVMFDPLGKQFGVGSGLIVSQDGTVVTNYHVIEAARTTDNLRIEVNGKLREVRGLRAFLPKYDLAILVMTVRRGEKLPVAVLAGKRPDQGEKAYTIGYPLGLPNATIAEGLINGHQKLGDIPLLQTSAPISQGSSGGPLLTPDGAVVGVTTLTLTGGQNLNFAVPIEHVRKLLRKKASLRKNIPQFLDPAALASLPEIAGKVSLTVPVYLNDLRAPMTLGRLYVGMAQGYLALGIANSGLDEANRKERFGGYVKILRAQKLIARHVVGDVEIVRLKPDQKRGRSLNYVRLKVTKNNDRRRLAACQGLLKQAETVSTLAVCRSPYWPGTFAAYLKPEDAAKLKPKDRARISGLISSWGAIPGKKKLVLMLMLDACRAEPLKPTKKPAPKKSPE